MPENCICNMFICMNDIVMYVGVSNNVYTRIYICKLILMHEQNGATCWYDQYLCIYAYVSMHKCVNMYVWTMYIYILKFSKHLLKSLYYTTETPCSVQSNNHIESRDVT